MRIVINLVLEDGEQLEWAWPVMLWWITYNIFRWILMDTAMDGMEARTSESSISFYIEYY